MPKYKKNYRKRGHTSRLRDSKLNTLVEKRMNAISKKNIKANEILHLYNKYFAADGYTQAGFVNLPLITEYRPVHGGAMEAKCISKIGGFTLDPAAPAIPVPQDQHTTIGISGIQCKFAFINSSQYTARVVVKLVYIPNLNRSTVDSIDYIIPSEFDLWKHGSGNLLFDGWNKKQLENQATTVDSKNAYTIIKRDVFHIRGVAPNDNITPRRKWLTKTWKTLRKHNIKVRTGESNQMLTDGNYYIIIHSDLPTIAATPLKYIAATSIKFKIFPSTFPVNYTP